MSKKYFSLIILNILFTNVNFLFSQDYPYESFKYDFINYEKSKIIYPGDSSSFETLYKKIDSLIIFGKGKVNIIHIGGSHIQAGIYSGQTRERLQTFFPGLNGGRGLIFPYKMSKSNNPNNYNITWTGKWTTSRNVEFKKNSDLGLLGICANTIDSTATLKIILGNKYVKYDFNKIRIFNKIGQQYYTIDIENYIGNKTIITDSINGITEINLDNYIDTLYLRLKKTNILQNQYSFFGISLENDDPGIVYNDAGINGASFPSFQRCNLFTSQLSEIKPDLVIISLGTNDTYTKNFDREFYKRNYIDMILKIREAAPNAAILMTVPNDDYFRRKYPNKNVEISEQVIMEVAKQYDCGVWDFYQIMGGFNSSSIWYKNNLMVYDRIHFTKEGYIIKGNLLFEAILKSYDNHIEKSKEL